MEAIFTNRVTTGKYATSPARDDFIDTATSDVAADFNIEDENNVPIDLAGEDTDTYFTDHHFEPSRNIDVRANSEPSRAYEIGPLHSAPSMGKKTFPRYS
ncbi:hypothetical protein GIB67_014782 [Kingdonia uniflora]|uniref:Uncharacterized protein n=1 Tax=Kingdonia uniflora TaxID=39325 RepID=A0A7J7NUT0_9MAGN|nr:hypothetical protein GIB67_014782 [Kingdonia uniflora]